METLIINCVITAVRAWIKDVELASNELGTHEVINVAAETAAGPLCWELERYPKSHTSSSVASSIEQRQGIFT